MTQITPPVGIGTDGPDGVIGDLPNDPGNGTGTYTVVSIVGNPLYVSLTPDGFYDLVFYESEFNGIIELDNIIIGISNDSNGATYYEIFNWGNNIPDTNTNVDTAILSSDPLCVTNPPECDNRDIQLSELYTDPGTGISTGILIDVDQSIGAPPGDVSYSYIIIISPNTGLGDVTQIDAIVVTEIAIPTPPPTPEAEPEMLAQSVVEEPAPVEVDPTPSIIEEIITELVSTIESLVTSSDTEPTPSPEEIITELAPEETSPTSNPEEIITELAPEEETSPTPNPEEIITELAPAEATPTP
ncbi:MAG: hypothetical protein JNK32_05225 [Anaerolineales bacterium]|nr:hypothetical protein [Anaerolineales bacterium]